MKNSYSLGNFTGQTGKFGLFGETWGSTKIVIENAFNAGGPIADGNYNNITDLKNVYSLSSGATYTTPTSYRAAETMQGKDALTNGDKMSGLAACGAFTATAEYPKLTAFMTEEEIISASVWDGTTKAPTGSGTEADPYIIANAENLAYVITKYNDDDTKHYKLTADIYLNDIDKIDWETGVVTEGYEVKQWLSRPAEDATEIDASYFSGIIDGDYHTIYGMYYSGENYAGLLPILTGSKSTTVKNLGIDCAYISGSPRASAFVGDGSDASSINIKGCYVGENVNITGENVGAFYGYGDAKFTINNCYSLATLDGDYKGLVGNIWGGGTVEKTFTNTDIAGKNANLVERTNDVYDGGYGKENMTGLGALTASTKMMNLGDAFVATVSYPVLKGFKYEPEYATVMLEADGGKLSEATVVGIVGSVAELPTPTKENYTFKGWYKDIALTIPADNVINSDCTYYAKWYMPYDVNKDNDASKAADLTALRKALLFDDYRESLTFSPDAADCNQDGNINILDLVRLKKKSVDADMSGNILEGYTLVWNDEFDGTAVSDKWGYKAHKISDVTSDSKKITVSDGVANFSLTKDDTTDGTTHYTFPSELVTDNTMNFKYGYVEVRAKLPFYGKGEFPAFWGLATGAELAKNTGSYKQADYNFELDVFENMSSINLIQSQIHLWNKSTSETNVTGLLDNDGYHGFENTETSDWHTYGMLWTKDEITFYVDGEEHASYTVADDYKTAFDNYSDLILTLSYYTPENVKGDSNRTAGKYFDDGNDELTMQIDYVRLYQNRATDSILIK